MKNSKIPWTNHTFNPWWGCNQVGPECTNCYAKSRDHRFFRGENWGPPSVTKRKTFGDAHWKKPEQWQRAAQSRGRYDLVFCGSMCDVFEDGGRELDELRVRLWRLIEHTPDLIWLLLTKRPENHELVPLAWQTGSRRPRNVWLGTSAGTQRTLDGRAPHLIRARWPTGRFLSAEPLLERIDVYPYLGPQSLAANSLGELHVVPGLDWVICGCEKIGNRPARRMAKAWARDLRRQCGVLNVPFFLKQMDVEGKVVECPELDNNTWTEMPVGLREP